MKCAQFDSLLDTHAVATLSAAARADLDNHLASCRRCADSWLAHDTLVREQQPAPPADLVGRMVAAAEAGAGAGEHDGRARHLAVAGRVAAAAALAVAAVFLWPSQPEHPGDAGIASPSAAVAPPADGQTLRTVTGPGALSGLTAGVQYASLAVPAPTSAPTGVIEVCEFFMFGCRHCFDFEAEFVAWSELQPDYVRVIRVPAIFNATARLHAQAFYTAEALGELDALIDPFYREIHVLGNALGSEAALRDFFVRHGVSPEQFDETFGSFGVAARVRQAEELNSRYRVNATPSIGVNGKYLTSPGMTGSTGAMLEVVDTLVAAEAPCEGDSGCPLGGTPVANPASDADLFR